jgi:trafficking protein particle complex subunit 5
VHQFHFILSSKTHTENVHLIVWQSKREIRLMSILQFVSTNVWKALFSKPADSLERSIDHDDEFMIIDHEPITSTFVSVPADFGQLSVDAYVSGIICGVIAGAGFDARVTAHSVRLDEAEHALINGAGNNEHTPPRKDKAVFLVKFSPEVLERDSTMDR